MRTLKFISLVVGMVLAFQLSITSAFATYMGPLEAYNQSEEPAEEEEADAIKLIDNMTDDLKEFLIRTVITEAEETKIARTLNGEDNRNNLMRRSAVVWCIFNRIDSPKFGNSVNSVVTRGAFHGLKCKSHPQWAHDLVRDVALRWALEKLGYDNVGRTLPKQYFYFSGNGKVNRFRTGNSRRYYNWNLEDPYLGAYSFKQLEEKKLEETENQIIE